MFYDIPACRSYHIYHASKYIHRYECNVDSTGMSKKYEEGRCEVIRGGELLSSMSINMSIHFIVTDSR